MTAQFAMLITPPSIPPAPAGDSDAVPGADLAERVVSGPGLWLDWLGELRRESLLEELLAEVAIARALEEAPHRHSYDRTLTGKMTVTCVPVACLFPGAGYDTALAAAFGPPYGYSLIDVGPHPNPAKAADGKRQHALAIDDPHPRWSAGSSPATWQAWASRPLPRP